MTRPSIRHLEYAVAVAEYLNFREAAKTCHVTQPALSAQIAQLEELLGIPLFERDRRRVLVTREGAAIIARARGILTQVDELIEAAGVLARPLSGTLRLGVIPTVAPYVLPRAVSRLRRAHPDLRLLLREDQTGELVRRLRDGQLDLLLLALEADLGEVDTLPLFEDPFLVAVPSDHPLAKRKRVRERDLIDESVLLLEDGHCLRDQVLEVCARARATELGDFRASSLTTLTQMAAGGIGITLLPEMAASRERSTRNLKLVPFAKPKPYRTIGLAWRRSSPRADEYHTLGDTLRSALVG